MLRKTENNNLYDALGLLGIKEVQLRGDEKTNLVSPKEHAKALFTYLNMAGYLSEELLKKAVNYLSASKSFVHDKEVVLSDLKKVCDLSNRNGQFDAEFFIANFAKEEYFSIDDVIDIIAFLNQTAFDRQLGVERDRLQAKPWLEEHKSAFIENATKLGIITPLPPLKNKYFAVGIMGGSSSRVKTRLDYFISLNIDCDFVLALSGNRELSKGLDEEPVMQAVASSLGKSVSYVKKKVGVDEREFLDGITETDMVNHLIKEKCPNKIIPIVDSSVQPGHWRATTAQSALDIVPIIIGKMESQKQDSPPHLLIIAEQPYAGRMEKQIQREFDKEIKKRGLEGKVVVKFEGSGPGVSQNSLSDSKELARINSELGALMAERFNDARFILQQQKPDLVLRDANLIMFSKRDATFEAYNKKGQSNESLQDEKRVLKYK